MNITQEVSQIVGQALLYLIEAGVLAGLFYARKLVQKYKSVLDSKLTASQRQLLDSIAQDAVVYVGKQWKEVNGQEKFTLAVQHVLDSANHYGLNLSVQDVQAAIEAAYQRSKVNSNTAGATVFQPTGDISGDRIVNVSLDGKEIAQTVFSNINESLVRTEKIADVGPTADKLVNANFGGITADKLSNDMINAIAGPIESDIQK